MRIRQIRLRVRDLERSIAFYRDLLGLQENSSEGLSGRVRECVTTNAYCEEFGIAFSQGLWDDTTAGPLEQVCFEIASVEQAAELYARAREMGAQAVPPRLHNGCWRTIIFDPDGHRLEVMVKNEKAAQGDVG